MEPKTVLIVEENFVIAEHLKSVLEEEGHKVAGIVGGEESIKVAKRARPDIILIDMHLNGPFDGVKMSERIQSHLDYKVGILFTSGQFSCEFSNTVDSAVFVIKKPFKNEEVLTALRNLENEISI